MRISESIRTLAPAPPPAGASMAPFAWSKACPLPAGDAAPWEPLVASIEPLGEMAGEMMSDSEGCRGRACDGDCDRAPPIPMYPLLLWPPRYALPCPPCPPLAPPPPPPKAPEAPALAPLVNQPPLSFFNRSTGGTKTANAPCTLPPPPLALRSKKRPNAYTKGTRTADGSSATSCAALLQTPATMTLRGTRGGAPAPRCAATARAFVPPNVVDAATLAARLVLSP